MKQPNPYDCGVFAIANATELAHNCDPALCRWDCNNLREHLLLCFENGRMERFPTLGTRRVRLGSQICKSITEAVLCICRMPNNKSRAMIQCDNCRVYYHMDCMDLDDHKSCEGQACMNMLDKMNN